MELLIGALILLIGMVLGRLSTRLRHRALEPKPICGCKHPYSFHNAGGACHWVEDSHWEYGRRIEDLCGCQRYTGPEPLPTYTAELS
jgi:hypothetical protein